MAEDSLGMLPNGQFSSDAEEAQNLLADSPQAEDDVGSPVANGRSPRPTPLRQSSFAQPRPDGTPRTPNRVRFDVQDSPVSERGEHTERRPNGDLHHSWIDDEDFLMEENRLLRTRSTSDAQRLPLLTDIEAPSVTLATEGDDFEAEDHLPSARPRSNLPNAFMNMANSIIGAGIIGQPYAFRQAGLLTGILLLIGLTVTVDWTIQLIVINSKLSGTDSFQGTVQHCFGKSGLIAISVAQWAFAFGGMVAFCIIVGDTIPHVLAALFPKLPTTPFLWLLTDRRAVIVLFILGISYPLSLYRDIAKLAKASTLALISMLIIIVTVITQGFRVPSDDRGSLRGSLFINQGIFQAIGVISFAFVCHHNSLLIYGSLSKPTLDRFRLVTHWSTGISMIACMIMALAGFLTFGSKTKGNVLNNFPRDWIMVNVARFCFGLNMLTTLPLEAFVCREVMTNYYFPGEPWNPHRHLIFSTSLVVAAMMLSLLTCDLGAVFELIGATSACALAYILPPLCYMKLSKSKEERWKRYLAGGVVAFGGIVMVLSLILAVAKMVRNEGGVKSCG